MRDNQGNLLPDNDPRIWGTLGNHWRGRGDGHEKAADWANHIKNCMFYL